MIKSEILIQSDRNNVKFLNSRKISPRFHYKNVCTAGLMDSRDTWYHPADHIIVDVYHFSEKRALINDHVHAIK